MCLRKVEDPNKDLPKSLRPICRRCRKRRLSKEEEQKKYKRTLSYLIPAINCFANSIIMSIQFVCMIAEGGFMIAYDRLAQDLVFLTIAMQTVFMATLVLVMFKLLQLERNKIRENVFWLSLNCLYHFCVLLLKSYTFKAYSVPKSTDAEDEKATNFLRALFVLDFIACCFFVCMSASFLLFRFTVYQGYVFCRCSVDETCPVLPDMVIEICHLRASKRQRCSCKLYHPIDRNECPYFVIQNRNERVKTIDGKDVIFPFTKYVKKSKSKKPSSSASKKPPGSAKKPSAKPPKPGAIPSPASNPSNNPSSSSNAKNTSPAVKPTSGEKPAGKGLASVEKTAAALPGKTPLKPSPSGTSIKVSAYLHPVGNLKQQSVYLNVGQKKK